MTKHDNFGQFQFVKICRLLAGRQPSGGRGGAAGVRRRTSGAGRQASGVGRQGRDIRRQPSGVSRHKLREPLHFGKSIQLQNGFPAFFPRWAINFRIFFPHIGQSGSSSFIVSSLRY